MINSGPYGHCTNKNNLTQKIGALSAYKKGLLQERKMGRRTKIWHISYKLAHIQWTREARMGKNVKLFIES
jgi:hypothetical protein